MTLMQWQQVDDVWEPYLVVNDQLRITPFRLQDVKDYVWEPAFRELPLTMGS